jgi:hypothetical protein
MKMDALSIYEILLGPNEGYFEILLYNSDFAPNINARLDLCYDLRVAKNPFWTYCSWDETVRGCGSATERVPLQRGEIYGFLKAKFPNKNWPKFITEKVKQEVIDLFEVFPEEPNSCVERNQEKAK